MHTILTGHSLPREWAVKRDWTDGPAGADMFSDGSVGTSDEITQVMKQVWCGVLALQGPPGTGKSIFTANLLVRRAVSGIRCVARTHSNGACGSLVAKLQDRICMLKPGFKVPILVHFQHQSSRAYEMLKHVKRCIANGNRPIE
ncbi:hypothetical protein PG994_004049 [Apiospora phragmitis]|uniref:DNA2/NAM7 helicase helicase domain-containing protein n=1 Tax=Apiospora phragmitis TaxID=2905665 RepID=A0ABR1W145_9PEZI